MRWPTLAVAAACLLPLAGCTEEPPREASLDPPRTSVADSRSRLEGHAAGFGGCSGFEAVGEYPLESSGAEHDPKWGEAGDYLLAPVIIKLYDCASVSIGPFQRPLRIILETHTELHAPVSCSKDTTLAGSSYVDFAMLASIWVDDAEVAAWLKAEYGMPAYHSEITEIQVQQPAYLEHRWSWGEQGMERSVLAVPEDRSDVKPLKTDWRYFWFNETSVSSMDWHAEDDAPYFKVPPVGFFPRPITGTLKPPMLGANFNETFAGHGWWLKRGEAIAEIRLYKDHFCTEPA